MTEVKSNIKPEVAFEELMKLDIRICEIINVEKVEKSNKLYKLTINTGSDERVVVSGLAKFYTEEQLKGRRIPFILNLAPRPIMGIESPGMIVAAQNNDATLSVLDADDNNSHAGAIVF